MHHMASLSFLHLTGVSISFPGNFIQLKKGAESDESFRWRTIISEDFRELSERNPTVVLSDSLTMLGDLAKVSKGAYT